jgi:hypothetical protein
MDFFNLISGFYWWVFVIEHGFVIKCCFYFLGIDGWFTLLFVLFILNFSFVRFQIFVDSTSHLKNKFDIRIKYLSTQKLSAESYIVMIFFWGTSIHIYIKMDRYVSDRNSWGFKWSLGPSCARSVNTRNIGWVYEVRRLIPKFQVLSIYKVKLKGSIVSQWKWIIFQVE